MSKKLVLSLAACALTLTPSSMLFAQRAVGGANPTPQAVGGANPTPQAVGGANPTPQAVGGANPTPQAVGGANPTPQIEAWIVVTMAIAGQ